MSHLSGIAVGSEALYNINGFSKLIKTQTNYLNYVLQKTKIYMHPYIFTQKYLHNTFLMIPVYDV